MKLIFALLGLVLAVNALPYNNNEGSNFRMVPDGDGNFHLVDLNQVESELENRFVPATDIFFLLFTRSNPNTAQRLQLTAASIANSNFNPAHPTRFTIHGWNNNGGSEVNVNIRRALLERGNFNVIAVDWGLGANANYATSRGRVGPVGAQVANFIRFLNTNSGVNPRAVHVIGHSLGAHAAGFVGKGLTGTMRLGIITALDAADPGFHIDTPSGRVHVDDAEYVESIHTNGGGLGMLNPLGDASFYPNFGRRQPGCGIDIGGGCAHGRAHQFYTESITTTRHFVGRQCRNMADINNENCVSSGANRRMGGEPADTAARGIFWVPVNSASPFATGSA